MMDNLKGTWHSQDGSELLIGSINEFPNGQYSIWVTFHPVKDDAFTLKGRGELFINNSTQGIQSTVFLTNPEQGGAQLARVSNWDGSLKNIEGEDILTMSWSILPLPGQITAGPARRETFRKSLPTSN
jgi:hypothetical protein